MTRTILKGGKLVSPTVETIADLVVELVDPRARWTVDDTDISSRRAGLPIPDGPVRAKWRPLTYADGDRQERGVSRSQDRMIPDSGLSTKDHRHFLQRINEGDPRRHRVPPISP